MTESRDFLKYCGLGLLTVSIFPGDLLSSSNRLEADGKKCCQPRRRLYGNYSRGCSGWHLNPNEISFPE